jgi:hypothetical protein
MESKLKQNSLSVFLDDARLTPDGFDVRTYTAEETIELVKTGKVTYISLDNDLGRKLEGYDVAKCIEDLAFWNKIPRIEWSIHSANPEARRFMVMALRNADRFWSQQEEKTDGI